MKKARGFTLVELLVVIAIIGILIGMLLPAVQTVRESARRTECSNNLRQMGLAVRTYESTFERLPAGAPELSSHGLFTFLLPYIEQQNVFDVCEFDGNTFDDPSRFTGISSYVCPTYPFESIVMSGNSSQVGAITTYQGVGGALVPQIRDPSEIASSPHGALPPNGIFGFRGSRTVDDISDGLSSTLMFGEFVQIDRDLSSGSFARAPGNIRPWILGASGNTAMYSFKVAEIAPNSRVNRVSDGIPFNHLPMGSFHPGATLFVFGDSSVQVVADAVNFDAYQSLSTIDGREVVSSDSF